MSQPIHDAFISAHTPRSQAEAFFRDFSRCIVSADGYSDLNQQMLYEDSKTASLE
ncbi:hypothetical protein F511_22472 [Dorcoceras hygrometricum]|uniref:Uncharacterized protein n=1 Tax=Dorcoceras hygrometricum TaxID=472368 RepID=A0A2Z7BDK7_9LAMI|nr:hypothetical protein F511_22472 [Dorcoceras hygrometricum]